jgi:hypothetical protein
VQLSASPHIALFARQARHLLYHALKHPRQLQIAPNWTPNACRDMRTVPSAVAGDISQQPCAHFFAPAIGDRPTQSMIGSGHTNNARGGFWNNASARSCFCPSSSPTLLTRLI